MVVWEEGGKSPGSWRQAKDDWVIITKKKGKVIRQLREQRKFCSGEDTEEGKAATAGRQKEAKARAKQRRRETNVDTEEEDKNQ